MDNYTLNFLLQEKKHLQNQYEVTRNEKILDNIHYIDVLIGKLYMLMPNNEWSL